MIVQGVEITEGQISPLVAMMKRVHQFSARDVEFLSEQQGVSAKDGISKRLADRLIQQQKKAGNIRCSGPCWFWVGRTR